MACSSCHRPDLAFSDGRQTAIGVTGERHPRNTPGLANVGYFSILSWVDPNETRLEQQSSRPLFGRHPIEMRVDGLQTYVLQRLGNDPNYQRLFAAAFPETGGAVDFPNIQKALAAFLRTLVSADSPYDRRLADPDALSPAARRGLDLFMGDRLGCGSCHTPPLFTDMNFHNTGLINADGNGGLPVGNQGLTEHTGDPADMGRFRTPSLRNVAVTAPYMHDGSVATLAAVIDHYAAGGRAAQNGARSPLAAPQIAGFPISDTEKADLIAFLEALTDEHFLTDPSIRSPFSYRPQGTSR